MRRSGLFSRVTRARALFAALCVGALVFAACGGDDDDDDTTDDTEAPTDDTEATTDETTGDADSGEPIKVGVVLVDYSAIADFVDFERGDQEAIAQAIIDDINESGRAGRQIEPVFLEYPPLPGGEPSPLAICTQMTDDEGVFAVLGVFIDFTGEGQRCITRDKNTIHVGHEMQEAWIEDSPPALLLTPGGTTEPSVRNLLELFEQEGTLEGRTVAVLGDNNAEGRINDVIVPGLEELGVDLGTTAVLTISGTDTTAAQAQMDAALETWKSEGVDTIFMAGLTASAKQFADKIAAELPDALLIGDSPSVGEQAQDAVAAAKEAGDDPVATNPYEGMLTIDGQTRSERWAAPNEKLQHCIDVVEAALGHEILGPDEVTPNEAGKNVEEYVAVEDFCDEFEVLLLGLEAVEGELNNDSWTEAIHGLGVVVLPTAEVASYCEGKYTGNDQFRIVTFDSTVGESGDFVGVTELADASGGQCG